MTIEEKRNRAIELILKLTPEQLEAALSAALEPDSKCSGSEGN